MSKGMNFLTSLLLFAAGVAIFIFLPVFQLDLGSQALKSETLLEYYENLIKDIQNVIESVNPQPNIVLLSLVFR